MTSTSRKKDGQHGNDRTHAKKHAKRNTHSKQGKSQRHKAKRDGGNHRHRRD